MQKRLETSCVQDIDGFIFEHQRVTVWGRGEPVVIESYPDWVAILAENPSWVADLGEPEIRVEVLD